jgi:hypothetical protein
LQERRRLLLERGERGLSLDMSVVVFQTGEQLVAIDDAHSAARENDIVAVRAARYSGVFRRQPVVSASLSFHGALEGA